MTRSVISNKVYYRVGLTRALRMPEHSEFAEARLTVSYRLQRAVYTKELMVTAEDFD